MNLFVLAYVIAVPLFVAIDMIWLLGVGRSFYVGEIGGLLRASPNFTAALSFYLMYVFGMVYFAVSGALHNGNPTQALLQGAIFGLIAYATYDLTSLAVLNGFTTKIAVIDMVWGSVLTGAVSWLVTRIVLALA